MDESVGPGCPVRIRQHHLPRTRIETDSYVAVQLLEAAGHLDLDTVRQMAEVLEGTFTFTILGSGGELYLVRGNNPLTVWQYPHLGLTVYASTEAILQMGVRAVRCLRRRPHEAVALEEGEILLLHSGGRQERCEFRLRSGCYSRFGTWGDWTLYGDLPRKRCGDHGQPQEDLLAFAREGDTIYIHDLSRLARSTGDLLRIVEQLNAKHIQLVSNKESIDSGTATGKLMLTMIGAINEFERQNLLERQREGIAIAKANGRYKGRCPVRVDSEKFAVLRRQYERRQLTKAGMARKLGISRPTLDKLLRGSVTP